MLCLALSSFASAYVVHLPRTEPRTCRAVVDESRSGNNEYFDVLEESSTVTR
jgi:hypothetical protein